MTDIALQRGKCAYWNCKGRTGGSMFCSEHRPTHCRICGCAPYGSRGLTLGLCIKHYKHFLRHNPATRPAVLAADHRQEARRTERRRAARAAAQAAGGADPHMAEVVRFPTERTVFGGWASGACGDDVTGRLFAVYEG